MYDNLTNFFSNNSDAIIIALAGGAFFAFIKYVPRIVFRITNRVVFRSWQKVQNANRRTNFVILIRYVKNPKWESYYRDRETYHFRQMIGYVMMAVFIVFFRFTRTDPSLALSIISLLITFYFSSRAGLNLGAYFSHADINRAARNMKVGVRLPPSKKRRKTR